MNVQNNNNNNNNKEEDDDVKPTLYEILRVESKTASSQEIEQAFRARIQYYLSKHVRFILNQFRDPFINEADLVVGSQKMLDLYNAYHVLSDPIQRSAYDNSQAREKELSSSKAINIDIVPTMKSCTNSKSNSKDNTKSYASAADGKEKNDLQPVILQLSSHCNKNQNSDASLSNKNINLNHNSTSSITTSSSSIMVAENGIRSNVAAPLHLAEKMAMLLEVSSSNFPLIPLHEQISNHKALDLYLSRINRSYPMNKSNCMQRCSPILNFEDNCHPSEPIKEDYTGNDDDDSEAHTLRNTQGTQQQEHNTLRSQSSSSVSVKKNTTEVEVYDRTVQLKRTRENNDSDSNKQKIQK